jgi:hypothetical protein
VEEHLIPEHASGSDEQEKEHSRLRSFLLLRLYLTYGQFNMDFAYIKRYWSISLRISPHELLLPHSGGVISIPWLVKKKYGIH